MIQDTTTISLVRRRWFAVSVAAGVMVAASILFAFTFRDHTISQRLDIVLIQLAGPIPSYEPLVRHPQFPWSFTVPVCTVIGIISHPIMPRWWTLCLTLCGGFFWWLWGWFSIVAGI